MTFREFPDMAMPKLPLSADSGSESLAGAVRTEKMSGVKFVTEPKFAIVQLEAAFGSKFRGRVEPPGTTLMKNLFETDS